jgi:hypothetical protein
VPDLAAESALRQQKMAGLLQALPQPDQLTMRILDFSCRIFGPIYFNDCSPLRRNYVTTPLI